LDGPGTKVYRQGEAAQNRGEPSKGDDFWAKLTEQRE
jgi:hypothetical protein